MKIEKTGIFPRGDKFGSRAEKERLDLRGIYKARQGKKRKNDAF